MSPKNSIKGDYLSIENTNCLKGLFAVFVVACHVRGNFLNLNSTLFGSLLTAMGYLSVAMFFFFSGYGLMMSFIKKGNDYIRNFPKRRLLPFYINYLSVIFIYIIYNLCVGKELKISGIIRTLFFGETIVNNGWYLQSILLLYILFYITALLFGFSLKILGVLITVLTYYLFCSILNVSPLLYESVFAFLLGAIWAKLRDTIDDFLNKKLIYIIFLISSFVLFCITLTLGNTAILSGGLKLIAKMISAIAFVLLCLAIFMKINMNNIITRMLGMVYLEIYVSHGIFIELYGYKYINITNATIYILLVCISTAVMTVIVKQIFKINKVLLKRVS